MTIKLRPFPVAVILLFLCFGHVTSHAQSVPRLLHYDGRLFVDGNPAFGSFEVTFSIYGTAEGGQALWSETQDVQPEDGQFSVLLGSVNPLPPGIPGDHDELYLAIQVENEAEMTPRLFMAATTFALRAGFADAVGDQSVVTAALVDAAVTTAKLADGSVTTSKLADEAITGAKLAAGAVSGGHLADAAVTPGKIAAEAAVVSLNDQTGPVSLAAGSNVSIVEADGTITISSVGGTGGGGGDITAVLAGEGMIGGGDQGDVMLSLADGAVDESKLADAAVTAAKLAPGAAVTSLNNQNGALTLAAGSNVNIEEGEGTLTISASGGLIGGGDITAVNAGSGLTGGGQTGDVTLAVGEEGVATAMLADEAVTTPKLGDGAVSLAKLASDAAVTRLNDQSGDVTLQGGDNVNIEASDGTITITSSGGAVGDITAVNAGDGLEGGGQTGSVTLAIADDGVTTAKIDDAAVTSDKLASDAAVLTLNSRRGAVNLAAGDNVSITESGQTITISAEEGAGGDITSVTAGAGLSGGGTAGDVALSLDPAAAVTSLNGTAGSVTLAAGENVSISGSGQTITISAEEGAGGDITSVNAGDGLEGGGQTGSVTLAIADDGVTTAKIDDAAVTSDKLASDAAVLTLNSRRGAVNLAAGDNVSITGSGQTITISAEEGAGGDITSVTAGAGLTGGGLTGDVSLALDPAAAVTSLNGTAGSVTLAAGENVSISGSGQTITISAEEGAGGDITSVTAGEGLTGGGSIGDVTLAILDLGVTTGKLADGAVTTAKLQTGAAVTSLNGIANDVTLVPGTDISITPSGGDITISYVGTPEQTQSSRRWKTNVQPLTDAVDVVKRLRGVSFEWKEDGREDIGLIAEEVGAVIPEIVVFEENGVDARTVNYSRLVSVLIEAVKAQQEQLDARDGVIDEMMERLDRLERLAQAPTIRPGTAQQASR